MSNEVLAKEKARLKNRLEKILVEHALLAAALKKTNELPDKWFGSEEASMDDLASEHVFIEDRLQEIDSQLEETSSSAD